MVLLKIKQFLSPPVFDDEDKTRVANLLSITLLTILLIAIIRSILIIWTPVYFFTYALKANLILIAILASVFIIMRFGYVRSACIFFTMYEWIAIAWILFSQGGISLSLYSFFILVILSAGLLLGGRWAVFYSIISIFFGSLLLYLESTNVITPAKENVVGTFSLITPSFITTTVLVYLYHRDMTRALKKSRSNTNQLSNMNEQLLNEISARQQMEEQLLQSQKMEAIGTLAGGIAHDFNNSLQAILGYIQILLFDQKEGSPEINELRQIESAAMRASELTKQLLTFSRKVESELRPVNLNQEVQQIEKILRRTIPRMIDIELHLQRQLKKINADPSQIEQILMNIGVNARDAMPDGGKLIICTENVILDEAYCKKNVEAVPGDYALLSISDNGIGMSKDTVERIFNPFFTTKDLGKGTGLGLSMVYGIVKNHGGHINCTSDPGTGTSFKIYFPVLQKDKSILPQEQEKSLMKGGTETILLVEDEAPIQQLGSTILQRFGYTILLAANGEEALSIYQAKKELISLIILDLIMPGMGGQKCFEEIIKIDPKQKIVIATGYFENGSKKELSQKGIKGYINKPYRMEQMLTVVRDVLDQK